MRPDWLPGLCAISGTLATANSPKVTSTTADSDLNSGAHLMISRPRMWRQFLDEYVSQACFKACWEKWLPYDIDMSRTGYFEVYADVFADPDDILSEPSSEFCKRLLSARAFQRCYISQCAGLNAKVPAGAYVANASTEGKLWAWTSEYVARYGPGPSSFENYRFSNSSAADSTHKYHGSDEDVWKPFAIGLTAACVMAPDMVFTANMVSSLLNSTIHITTTDKRVTIPHGLRRLLIPIWTSPNLTNYWNWKLPQYWHDRTIDDSSLVNNDQPKSAEAEFEEPRKLTDIGEKMAPVYALTCIAYAHLLSMTSKSRQLHIDMIRTVTNALLPGFAIVQMVHGCVDACLILLEGRTWNWSYLLAGVLGTMVVDEQSSLSAPLFSFDVGELDESRKESRRLTWWLRIAGIAMNTAPLLMTLIQYFSRVLYRFHNRTYCATTGFDHRLGWIAFSSLSSIIATTILYIQDKTWTPNPAFFRGPVDHDPVTRLALQTFTSAVVLELLVHVTDRTTLVQVVFSRWLGDSSQFIVTAVSLLLAILSSAGGPLYIQYNRPNSRFRKTISWMFLVSSLTYAILLFLLQLFMDIEEYADLVLGFVLPWNFRWEVPSPAWTKWWSV